MAYKVDELPQLEGENTKAIKNEMRARTSIIMNEYLVKLRWHVRRQGEAV